jgi:exopolysaccharide biosynthesis WecB/TagA/CpsF family protein
MQPVTLLGLDFDDLDIGDVLHALLMRAPHQRFTYIVTPNADHLARLKRQPRLRIVYDAAWLRLLDSQMLRNAARGLGLHTPTVATGADITQALLEALDGQTVAVIGLDPAYLPALRATYPRVDFVHHAPPRDLLGDDIAFRRARDFAVRTAAPFTFIALGSPLQELLAYAIALQPRARGIGLCIGAALEFRAGAAARAPSWMRKAGLEWFHRLCANPARLGRRYLLDDPPILLDLLAERFSRKLPRSAPAPRLPALPGSISAPGPYPRPPPAPLREIPDAG